MAKRQRQELTSLAILPIAWDTFSASLAEADSETEFAKAGKIDSQPEKVKAETLDGELCTKKKCKVFDLIVCTR